MKILPNYNSYSLQDFVDDQSFWLWVLHEEENACSFWSKFFEENPEKVGVIEQAKQRVLDLNTSRFTLDEKRVSSIWQNIIASKEL